MKEIVHNSVNKSWAREAKNILTGCYQDLSTIYTRLHTMTLEQQKKLKSTAAQHKLQSSCTTVIEGLKYGWHSGISGKKPGQGGGLGGVKERRLKLLLKLAIKTGAYTGTTQLKHLRERHANHLRNENTAITGASQTAIG